MAILLQGNAFISSGSRNSGTGSVALANCKGHVHTFDGPSNGFYELDPAIPDAQDSKALVLGVPLTFMVVHDMLIAMRTKTASSRVITYCWR